MYTIKLQRNDKKVETHTHTNIKKEVLTNRTIELATIYRRNHKYLNEFESNEKINHAFYGIQSPKRHSLPVPTITTKHTHSLVRHFKCVVFVSGTFIEIFNVNFNIQWKGGLFFIGRNYVSLLNYYMCRL